MRTPKTRGRLRKKIGPGHPHQPTQRLAETAEPKKHAACNISYSRKSKTTTNPLHQILNDCDLRLTISVFSNGADNLQKGLTVIISLRKSI
ncbi:hypothetical protein CTI12_AA586640 [Artemisia annua]|uniref:Uncharacterized protein n=1 Tax=Artemisia annua TaxID=35608 RepID=A0A2U1KJY4_ARTAN|nr:hypothetical protein CTI12_AA586640 [Artemisia annua]